MQDARMGASPWRLDPSAAFSAFPRRFQRNPSSGSYRPEIDGLRFFAIAIVVVGHLVERATRFFPSYQAIVDHSAIARLLQIQPVGVFLFFSISGFIIATQARRARGAPLSPGFLKTYFLRRVLRIEPPYVILLIATWALLNATHYVPEGVRLYLVEPQSLDESLLGSIFYAHDLIWGTYPRLFPPGWTLELEVQFYILAPVLIWAWMRADHPLARSALALGLLGLSSVFVIAPVGKLGPLFLDRSLVNYFNYFWLGIVLANLQEAIAERASRLPTAFITLAGWSGVAAFVLLPDVSHEPIAIQALNLAVAYAAFLAMFASALAPCSGFRKFCAWPWISLIGGACYSIYLTHVQTMQVASSLAAKIAPDLSFAATLGLMTIEAGVVTAVGLAFYVCVEHVFMRPDWHVRLGRALRALWRPFYARRSLPADPAE